MLTIGIEIWQFNNEPKSKKYKYRYKLFIFSKYPIRDISRSFNLYLNLITLDFIAYS